MKVTIVLGAVLFAILAGGVDSRSSNAPPYRLASYQDQDPAIPNTNIDPNFQKFQRFIEQYSKKYRNIEELKSRFDIFKRNLREVERLNAMDSSAKYAINELSDRTQKELHGMNGFRGHNDNASSSFNANYKSRDSIFL